MFGLDDTVLLLLALLAATAGALTMLLLSRRSPFQRRNAPRCPADEPR